MRFVFIGASALAVATIRRLLDEGHEATVVDEDAALLDELSESVDCGFVCGDGTRLELLEELAPERSDALLAVTSNDETNMLIALVARQLGYPRVIVRLHDERLEPICAQLDLLEVMVKERQESALLCDRLTRNETGSQTLTLAGDELRCFRVQLDEASQFSHWQQADGVQIACVVRDETSLLATRAESVEDGDLLDLIATPKAFRAARKALG